MMDVLKKSRVESIDVLRGIVMIIMALDHVRDYFHVGANLDDPLNLVTTTPALYFTRWITHFCAPVFVFLSGTSIYLQSLRKTKKALSLFLIKRGLWLILLELIVITFGWTFNFHYNTFIFQVIWAIGISMFLLGCLIHLPFKAVVGIGLMIVFLHNLLDYLEAKPDYKAGLLLEVMHHKGFAVYPLVPNHVIMIAYSFLPWTGLMMVGYGFGKIMQQPDRKKKLNTLGLSFIALFIFLRFLNVYGDPVQWTPQRTSFYTFLSFLNVNKYPPSLLYMCVTIGPALLVLAFIDSIQNRVTEMLKVFGRVSLFYYVLHLYLIHLLCMISYLMQGHTIQEAYSTPPNTLFYFVTAGVGYNLPMVYAIWVVVVVLLYPLCKWYDQYKTAHKEKWWLSYL
jgi:uncharacterized membrane protein